MRKIYIIAIAALVASIILFMASFIYLDTIKHKTFYYVINSSGRDTGSIRIDRFITDEKIIYKSATSLPFEPVYTETRSRLVLNRGYDLESYTMERLSDKGADVLYLENFKNLVSFISRSQYKFSCLDNIAIRKQTFVFEENSPLTYMPIIENYDFSKGRSQGFNAISPMQEWNLPPAKRFVTLTSIRNEYIKIQSKKIKAENLVLKIRDYPQGMVWVSMTDRALLKIEIPSRGLTITRTFKPAAFRSKERKIEPEGYISKEVNFKSKKNEISGTAAYPSGSGPYPAVVLVQGAGFQDRQCRGLFTAIADYLAKNGFATLRFDARGAIPMDKDGVENLEAAIKFMADQSFSDREKIFLIGHGRGAIYALGAAINGAAVKGLVMMAPELPASFEYPAAKETPKGASKKPKWSDDYSALIARSIKETSGRVLSSEGDTVYILGKKCFLGDMRAEMGERPLENAGKLKIPALLLQSKDTGDSQADSAALLDKAMADGGNSKHTLTYYAYLGQFFGREIRDGINRYYYDTDKEVLENIRNWLTGLK
ncbi:MAG: alpha/beta hydrolase [Candidatus Omnitrophica bacterium]|nr:alpha/beta hydrolase [Candidatus Omnitrophota bacterium]